MIYLSRFQAQFGAISILLTTFFFILLHKFVIIEDGRSILILASSYGISMMLNGLANGYFDPIEKLRMDIGFRYHLITFLVVNVIALIFIILPSFSQFSLEAFGLGILSWGLGLLIHYLISRRSIKGYSSDEIFK